ncbi:hypothetical protein DPMN_051074 [Dreissena polymorpha]|uniref:Cadherin domain-containing protein n=1 Tax=Dreissena polymorpha TaxID=45954 RepID=A0A9D4CH91_DREPO|nr:hypothetical protein DPMN_051074 [Dreissena polymorpha]
MEVSQSISKGSLINKVYCNTTDFPEEQDFCSFYINDAPAWLFVEPDSGDISVTGPIFDSGKINCTICAKNRREKISCKKLTITIYTSYVNNLPHTTSLHENTDNQKNVWRVAARCDVTHTCGAFTCSSLANCDSCSVDNGLFGANVLNIYKRACTKRLCNPCYISDFCGTKDTSIPYTVSCTATGYISTGTATASATLTFTADVNPPFAFAVDLGSSITIGQSIRTGSVVNKVFSNPKETSDDNDNVTFTIEGGRPSWLNVDSVNGDIKVISTLTSETSQSYTVNVCAKNRRNLATCNDLDITMYYNSITSVPYISDLHENTDDKKFIWDVRATCEITYTCFTNYTCSKSVDCDSCSVSNSDNFFGIDGFAVYKKECQNKLCDDCDIAEFCVNAFEFYDYTVPCVRVNENYINFTTGTASLTKRLSFFEDVNPSFDFEIKLGNNIFIGKSIDGTNQTVNKVFSSPNETSDDNDYVKFYIESGDKPDWLAVVRETGEVQVTQKMTSEIADSLSTEICVENRRHHKTCKNLTITIYHTSIKNSPDIVELHENTDRVKMLWRVTGTCDITYTCHGIYTCSETHDCDSCRVTDDYNFFRIAEPEHEVYKKQCKVPLCKTCYIADFCANENESYHYTVDCVKTNYNNFGNFTSGHGINTSSLSFYKDVVPELYYAEGTHVNVFKNNSFVGTVINKMISNPIEEEDDNDNITYYTTIEPRPSWIHNKQLFTLDTSNGNIKVAEPLTDQFSYSFNMTNCVINRRGFEHCENFDITLWACYQTPNCTDQEILDLWDTHGILGHSSNNSLFKMIYPQPIYHFPDFRNTWSQLTWALENGGFEEATIDPLTEYCGTTPECSSDSVTNDTELAVSSVIFNVQNLVTNPNSFQALEYSLTTKHPDLFEINSTTGLIRTTSKIPAKYPSTTYVLNAFVTDVDSCGTYSVCPLFLHVTYVNYPLNITNLPNTSPVKILEDEDTNMLLYTIETYDRNPDDDVLCSVSNPDENKPFYIDETFKGSGIFVIKNHVAGTNTERQLSEPSYTITIRCVDSLGDGDTGDLSIDVIPNTGPTLTTLTGTLNRDVDQSTVFMGMTLLTERAMDAEGDSLNYTCTVDNSNNPLTCFVDESFVLIKLRRNVSITTERGKVFAIDVCVGDPKHPNHDCGRLEVTFNSSNSYPSIINLPFVKHVPEDSVIGTVLFTPEVEDIDLPVEPKTFDMTVLPASASGYFSLDKSTGSVILSKKLDYESLQKYSVLMRVHDTYLRSQSSKVLVINVTDVNEPNRISAKFTTKTFKETKKRGTKFDFELECSDEDFYDQQTLTIVSGTYKDYFSLNNSDRKIYLEKVWDLEDPVTRLPSSTMITVQCEDSANHTAIEYLEFVIEDVREQRPDISYALPSGESTLILQINSSTPLALVLLTVTVHLNANERDIFSFGIIGNGLGRKYFRMERVYPRKRSTDTVQAQLKLRQPMKLNYHKSFSFNIKVSDGGTPPLISAIPMSVNYTADAHVPKEADINKCVTCSHTGRSLIGMLVVECLIIAGLFVHGLVAMGIICKSNNRLKKLFSKAGKKIYKGRWKITSNPAKTRFKPRNQGLNAGGSRSKPDSAIPSSSSSSLEGEEEVSGSRRYSTARADHVARHKFHAKRYTTGMDWGPSTSTGLPRPIYSQDVTGETEPEGIGRTLAQIVRERRKVRKEESIIISRVLGRKKSSGGDSRSKLAFGLPIKNVTSSGALPGGIYAGREGYET